MLSSQPAHANTDGKVVCFLRDRRNSKERYTMFGFNDSAHPDDGAFCPVAFALPELTVGDEAKIGAPVKNAVS